MTEVTGPIARQLAHSTEKKLMMSLSPCGYVVSQLYLTTWYLSAMITLIPTPTVISTFKKLKVPLRLASTEVCHSEEMGHFRLDSHFFRCTANMCNSNDTGQNLPRLWK